MKLKPCHFCGNKRVLMKTDYDTVGNDCTLNYIECDKCGARTRGKWVSANNDCPQFYEEVRDQWNFRAEGESEK